MLISTNIRNWGPSSAPRTLIKCVKLAEAGGMNT